ncbi:SDR family NAD(P)-dependent oxidoreductase [Reichenbachiella sp.]|uniref:SDR family NAD(P)-dependent oxidoreductase n=1 Tax=Reichenbachiella sp. TaxID=2184521 RepID=UPI003BAE7DD5
MKKTVVITGALGGIGQAICKTFKEDGYQVLGIDVKAIGNIPFCDYSFDFDLSRLSKNEDYRSDKLNILNKFGDDLHVLINNAAVQILNNLKDIKITEWNETLDVNLTAPMLLSQWALPYISKNDGSIINISSIHQTLTKPKFTAYATSKSALVGLTKAMAVDLNGEIRVNSISPAAIETDMLRAGFNNDESALDVLKKLHPVQRIGYPYEVAKLALFLASDEAKFINGANLQLDGGISSVLHDL